MKSVRRVAISWSFLTILTGCGANRPGPDVDLKQELARLSPSSQSATLPPATDSHATDVPADIQKFCGDCHALPRATSFNREAWYDEIRKGFEFYARSGRTDLKPPAPERVVEFYRQRAPTEINFPEPTAIDETWRSRFEREAVDWDNDRKGALAPAVSSIRWTKLEPEGAQRLLVTDMREGSVNLVALAPKNSDRQLIGRVGVPARAVAGDLDQDGTTDLIVSDLGSFNPYDHHLGRVVWLKREPVNRQFRPIVIADKLGRVADCSIDDFSGDGKPDVIVAEFGHRETGGIRLLTNASVDDASAGAVSAHDVPADQASASDRSANGTLAPEKVRFSQTMLDIRPGTMQVPAHDWNGDGAMDFAAVLSQEFECVELFISNGRKFDRHRAGTGSDLTFGSVGIDLADLDGDGDQDIIYVNGDCFDNNFANRAHGIQWLENQGNFEFRSHRLIELPGAYRAVAADVDADGDLDIVGVANLPTVVYPLELNERSPASIVLLEQVASRRFELRVLERGTPRYPALEVADFNSDGKMDFAVGAQLFETDPADSPAAKLPRLAIWWQK